MGAHMSSLASLPQADSPTLLPQRYAAPSTVGYILYWVVFGIMTGAAILFSFLTFKHQQKDRKHGYLTAAIVTVAATAYYSMASHGGDSYIPLYWDLGGARDVFWARYIDWFITTPLLLLDVLMLATVPIGTALWVVFADVLMILFGLFGAITSHHYRWGYFAIGCFWMFVVFWGLFITGPRYAFKRDTQLGRYYIFFAGVLGILWCLYPIVWGLAEGSNTISVTAEIACYGALDLSAKVVWGLLFLMAHERVISTKLEEERRRGKYAMSLLSAPVTSPLHAVELGLAKHPAFAAHGQPEGDHYHGPYHSMTPQADSAPAGVHNSDATPYGVFVSSRRV